MIFVWNFTYLTPVAICHCHQTKVKETVAAFRLQMWWVSFVRTFTVGISRLNILGFDTASMAAYNFLSYEDGGSTFLWNISVNLQVYMESKHQRYNQKFHENIIVWCIYLIFILPNDVDPNIHHPLILII